ncbi:putative 3-oxoacyl-(acyl-carrier-protein) reductase [metagenome]|uniref:Putative 3-oxoacyl-(Acyl-carrier-protein) reductase n=1 Tax=metagenome TaxID=256318 RepID=A0A2P2C0J2_9ZZZZ
MNTSARVGAVSSTQVGVALTISVELEQDAGSAPTLPQLLGANWREVVERPALEVMQALAAVDEPSLVPTLESVTVHVGVSGSGAVDAVGEAALQAIRGAAGSAALELGGQGIRVNTLVTNDQTSSSDVALTSEYLANSEHSGYTTGATLDLRRQLTAPVPTRRGGAVLVTGAAGGLGRAGAEALMEQGRTVILTDLPGSALDAAASELGAEAVGADLSSAADLDALAVLVVSRGVDTVVIEHGVSAATRMDSTYDPARAGLSMRINATSVWELVRRVAGPLRDGGTIVALSSQAGLVAEEGYGPYSAAKFAVVGMARSLVSGLADSGVRIQLLCPGPIETELLQQGLAAAARDRGISAAEFAASRAAAIPLRRFGQPRHIGHATRYLTQLDATGVLLAPNGGEVLT